MEESKRTANGTNRNPLFGILTMMIFQADKLLPAIVLLVMHFVTGLPLKWAGLALLLWLVYVLLFFGAVVLAGRCRNIPQNQRGISLHPGRTAYFDAMYKKAEYVRE